MTDIVLFFILFTVLRREMQRHSLVLERKAAPRGVLTCLGVGLSHTVFLSG